MFLSHAGGDTAAARAFATLLRRNGIDVWFDKDDFQPGDRWMETLEEALEKSSALVVYVGRLGVQHWVDREVRVGLELNTRNPRGFKIIPVFGEGADVARLPPFLRQHQGIPADDPHAIRRLVEVLHGDAGPAVRAAYWETHSPFRSLHAFEPEDSWLFFGRDHEIGELLDCMERARVQIVIGNSGSGKSSLVRAGLIPALQRGRLQVNGHAVERWRIATFRPGSDPFGELVDRLPGQLAPELGPADRDALITRWRKTFHRGGNAVRNGLAALSTDQSRTLLFADQFEELFTTVTDHDVQQRYIDALLRTTEAEGVHLIIGVRADFYVNCLQHPPLKPFLQGNYSVLLMQPDQLRQAVDKRLALASVRAEPGLIDTLVDDVGAEPGNLALLEHTLAQLWEPATGPYASARLTNHRYEEIGRLRGAIGTHAQGVYSALTAEQQLLARKVFVELVHLGEGAPDTRRRVAKGALLALADSHVVERLLDVLASARLLATTSQAGSDTGFVEVSHEALIREWTSLRAWVDEDREDLRFGRRLGTDADEWAAAQDTGSLLHGVRLLKAREWLDQHPEAPEAVQAFVDASTADEASAHAAQLDQERRLREVAEARELAERELRAESDARALAEQELRTESEARANAERDSREHAQGRAQLFRRFGWGMAGLAVVALITAGYAVGQQRVAQSRQLAAEAQELRRRDQSAALNLAISAWSISHTAEASRAVADAFSTSPTVLAGHTGPVVSAAFSPNGQRVVTASEDGTAQVWEVGTGEMVALLTPSSSPNLWDGFKGVTSAAFSPNGRSIVTANEDGTARVWEAGTGQLVATLQGHTHSVTSAAFSPNSQWIVTASKDGTARIWEAATGHPVAMRQEHTTMVTSAAFSPNGQWILTVSGLGALVSQAGTGQLVTLLALPVGGTVTVTLDNFMTSAAFSQNGQWVVTTNQDGMARVWEAGTGRVVATLQQRHEKAVTSAAFSPNGQWVVTASDDKTARVWEAKTGQLVATLQGHTDRVTSAAFSPNGQWVVTASDDKTARVWEAKTGQLLATLRGHTDRVTSAAFSQPDGQRVVTASADGTAQLWPMWTGSLVATLQGHADGVMSAAFSPNGQWVATASDDKTARVWEAKTGQLVTTLQGHTDRVTSAEFSPNGQWVATASDDKTARVWEAKTGQLVTTLQGHTGHVTSAVFSPNGQWVATASDDKTARVWEAKTGQSVTTLQGHAGSVWSAAFSPNGQWVATASDDKTARVWEAKTGQLVTTLQGHAGSVWSAAFSPNGRWIATASDDKTARVWEAKTGQSVTTLQGHTESVWNVAFSPDGQRVATGSEDQTARVWDARSGEALATLQGHTDVVNAAVFSPGGRWVVTASSDGTARVWEARSGQFVAALQGVQGPFATTNDSVTSAVFSPNGQWVVTASEDGTARVFRILGLNDVVGILAN